MPGLDLEKSICKKSDNNALSRRHVLPDTKVGTFTQALYDEAKSKGWSVISMKNDWKQIFAWEK